MDPVTYRDPVAQREYDAVQVFAEADSRLSPLLVHAGRALVAEVERLRAEAARPEAPSTPEHIADMLAGSPAAYTLTRYVSAAGTVLGCSPDNWNTLRGLGLVETGRGGRRKVSDLGDSVRAVLRERRHG